MRFDKRIRSAFPNGRPQGSPLLDASSSHINVYSRGDPCGRPYLSLQNHNLQQARITYLLLLEHVTHNHGPMLNALSLSCCTHSRQWYS